MPNSPMIVLGLSAFYHDSAACLVSDENDMGAHMERLMQKLGREDELPGAKRILELNASHPAVTALKTLHGNNADDPRVGGWAAKHTCPEHAREGRVLTVLGAASGLFGALGSSDRCTNDSV